MKRTLPVLLVMFFAAVMLTGCLVGRGPRGEAVYIVPPLPPVVELQDEPYYYQNNYHYYYRDNGWYYSKSRNGPWEPLPRDRYPKETRIKNRHEEGNQEQRRDQGHQGDRDNERGHDERDRR